MSFLIPFEMFDNNVRNLISAQGFSIFHFYILHFNVELKVNIRSLGWEMLFLKIARTLSEILMVELLPNTT